MNTWRSFIIRFIPSRPWPVVFLGDTSRRDRNQYARLSLDFHVDLSVVVAISALIPFAISLLMGLAYEFRTHSSWHKPPNFPTSCHGAVQGQFQFSLQGPRQRRGTLNEVLGSSPGICWNEVLGSSPDMCLNDVLTSCPDMRLNEVLGPSPNMRWNEVAGSSPDIMFE